MITRAGGCLLLLALGCAAPEPLAPPSPQPAAGTASPPAEVECRPHEPRADEAQWGALLAAALAHGEAERRFVESAVDTAGSEETRRLAALLLDEWSLPATHWRISRPRPVTAVALPEEELIAELPERFEAQQVILSAHVRPDGRVGRVSFLKPSDYQAANRLAAAALCSARYRPARGAAGYLEAQAQVSIGLGVS